jgi:dihydrofolate reductase
MKFICAISPDGYMAQGPNDNMSWTPKIDKKIFQLISSLNNGICFVSEQTMKNMPQNLIGRTLIPISRKGLTLQLAEKMFPNSLLIGGPTLLRAANQLNLIDELIINQVNTSLQPFIGVSEEYRFPFEELQHIITNKIISIEFGDVTTSIYRNVR